MTVETTAETKKKQQRMMMHRRVLGIGYIYSCAVQADGPQSTRTSLRASLIMMRMTTTTVMGLKLTQRPQQQEQQEQQEQQKRRQRRRVPGCLVV